VAAKRSGRLRAAMHQPCSLAMSAKAPEGVSEIRKWRLRRKREESSEALKARQLAKLLLNIYTMSAGGSII